jgi:hypothetical protein
VNITKKLKIEVILLNVIDGSAPLIPCKDGNLRLFMEKEGHCKDIQLGNFFIEVRLVVLLMS